MSLPHPRRAEIIHRRLLGDSPGLIANELGVSERAVSGICRRANVHDVIIRRKLQRLAPVPSRYALTESERDAIAYRAAQGEPEQQIAECFEISVRRARYIAAARGPALSPCQEAA